MAAPPLNKGTARGPCSSAARLLAPTRTPRSLGVLLTPFSPSLRRNHVGTSKSTLPSERRPGALPKPTPVVRECCTTGADDRRSLADSTHGGRTRQGRGNRNMAMTRVKPAVAGVTAMMREAQAQEMSPPNPQCADGSPKYAAAARASSSATAWRSAGGWSTSTSAPWRSTSMRSSR